METIPKITLTMSDMVEGAVLDGSTIILSRIGNLVCTRIRIAPADKWISGTTYAVLPEGYRPATPCLFPMGLLNGGAVYGEIYKTGECKIVDYGSHAGWTSATLAYFTDSL